MRILVTGHRGNLGVPIARHLDHLGHDVVGFDRVDGQDLLDLVVNRAAVGCAAIVHLGALAHDTAGSQEQIMAVNVLGTWHVLLAAETAGAARVIHFSSAQVFGIAEGERLPDYFPVDDAHPRRAIGAYGLSKCLGEDLCAAFTARTGIPSMSLLPWRFGIRASISGPLPGGVPRLRGVDRGAGSTTHIVPAESVCLSMPCRIMRTGRRSANSVRPSSRLSALAPNREVRTVGYAGSRGP